MDSFMIQGPNELGGLDWLDLLVLNLTSIPVLHSSHMHEQCQPYSSASNSIN
jgi:hypothetical protein